MSSLFSNPALDPGFYCSICELYKEKSQRCESLLCCKKCKSAVLAADKSKELDETDKVKVLSISLKRKRQLDDRAYQRELNSIDNWMVE